MTDKIERIHEIKEELDILITELMSVKADSPVINTGWMLVSRGTGYDQDTNRTSINFSENLDFISIVGLSEFASMHTQRRFNKEAS